MPGRSRFAQRGVSNEERMRDDDSARRFPGRSTTREDARYDARFREPEGEGRYGSGGSYGYGGGFEHGGEPGYRQSEQRGSYGRGDEEFYETTGGFGYDVSGYGAGGLGYPGAGEDRYGSPGPRGRRPEPHRDDPRKGYVQDSGYAQSGGAQQEHTGQGSGYGSSDQHSDGRGHDGGGMQRFHGSSSGGQPGRGRFYGRTPQGYTRSDERIREDVCDRLSHGHIDPSELSVKVEAGVVTLEGFANNRADKFHAEEVADGVLGVKDVDNRIRVRKADSTRDSENAWTPSKQDEASNAEASKPRNGTRGAS